MLVAGTNHGIYALNRGQTAWRMAGTVVAEKQVKVPAKTKKGKPTFRTEYVKSEISGRINQLDIKSGLWIAAASSGLYTSADSGKTWHGGPILGETGFVSVQSLETNVVAAAVNAVIVSKDNGATWSKAALPHYVQAIFGATIAPGSIWLATREGALRSTDGGATWEHMLGGLPSRNLAAIEYDSYGHRLLATASRGELFESRDSGDSWQKLDSPWMIRNVAPSKGKLFAITAFDGLILKDEAQGRQRAANAASNK
jgi:photosystem II stability/assembly factor-like uncharacterized protein